MKTKKTLGLSVPFHDAEIVRKLLIKQHLIISDQIFQKENNTIIFPVKKIPKELKKYTRVYRVFERKKRHTPSYKEIISLPKNLKKELPTSYDIIGDIVLLKIPDSLKKYEKKIGKAILDTHKHIKTVLVVKPVQGELRLRSVQIIAGEQKTTTTHKEYGLYFFVDVEKTYFSPRLASERKRVAALVQPGEVVVDLFAGVGPFSCIIAKYAQPKYIFSVDKNQDAIALAQQNIIKNNLLDTVEVIHADAKEIPMFLKKKNISADRIIMNLPFDAYQFFTTALTILKERGVIHYYAISSEENIQNIKRYLTEEAKKLEYSLISFQVHKIKTYATREFYIGIDITATKMPM